MNDSLIDSNFNLVTLQYRVENEWLTKHWSNNGEMFSLQNENRKQLNNTKKILRLIKVRNTKNDSRGI